MFLGERGEGFGGGKTRWLRSFTRKQRGFRMTGAEEEGRRGKGRKAA